jgi:hypothetical protein
MKKLLFILCFAAAAVGVRAAEPVCEMAFVSTEHNFGKVAERGGTVSHVFEFTNTGTHPIVITRVSTTCKCTKYDFSKRPVMPGGKGRITVSYNPKKQSGVFYKVIQVFTNCSQERVLLTIKGEIRVPAQGK